MKRIYASHLGQLLLPLALSSPATLYADVAQSPLYLTTSVKPNILFLIDDSTSMKWEVVKSTAAGNISDYDGFIGEGGVHEDPDPDDRERILETCVGYNTLYYDPSKTYEPWNGFDENGDPFTDQSITSALDDPYDANGDRVDLSDTSGDAYGYMPWSDDGDGVFEIGECPDPDRSGYDYNNQFVATAAGAGPVNVMSTDQQTNFANWYTYYRSRDHVMKAALLQIANESDLRLGLATLHTNNDVSFPVVDMEEGSNKSDLMEQITQILPDGGTPLRSKLEQAGEYFKGTTSSALFGSTQSSPILDEDAGGACQQNFVVLMSDGYWKGDDPSVGNADSGSSGDGDQNDTEFDGGSYADDHANTLADVAMHYYETDLSDLDDRVPTSWNDSNTQQHLVTYTVAFGVDGTLSAGPDSGDTSFDWPEPEAKTDTTIDDMRHAAWNGRGEFLDANAPQALVDAFSDALSSIGTRTSSAAALATNSTRLNSDSKLYQARFDSGEWVGQLLAYSLDSATGSVDTLLWDAADLLPPAGSRNIYTYNGGGISFDTTSWDGGLFSSSQVAALNAVDGTTDNRGRDRVDYLRGDSSYEGSDFRSRVSRLGDIVNSDPVYTENERFNYYGLAPDTSVGGVDTDSYYLYLTDDSVATNKASRDAMIYVGANDGMLHGFSAEGEIGESIDAPCDAATETCEGEEVFAYIPKALYSSLSDLTDIEYSHKYFVDGSIRVADAYIDFNDEGVSSGERWGSVLIGMLGGGGAGVYALDVSDPLNFDASDVLWDLDSTDLSELGYTFGSASVVKLPDGTWAAIFGNGYESANHKAGLYIVNLEDPTDVVFIDTEADGSSSSPNGLSSPLPVDSDGDEIADAVYAGDLYGNLWKFDLSSSNRNAWDVAFKQGSTPEPLFRACENDDCNSPQPITARPEVTKHSSGGVMVFFGTGRYLYESDTSSTQEQTFYGIRDWGSQVSGRSSLQAQDILVEAYSDAGETDYRVTSNTTVDYTVKSGWYLDFDSSDFVGERVVSDALSRNGRIAFVTLSPSASPCDFGGTSWFMELDAENGSRLSYSPFDVNGDGVADNSDYLTVTLPDEPTSAGVTVAVSGRKSTVGAVKTPTVVSTNEKTVNLFSGDSTNIEGFNGPNSDDSGRQSWAQLQ